jgi:hypothetical protein
VTSPDGEDRFAGFDVVLKRRGRSRWRWAVCTAAGEVVMSGSECSRAGARYKAERALFLLLLRKRVACGFGRRVAGNRLGTLVVVSRLSGSRPAETDSDA